MNCILSLVVIKDIQQVVLEIVLFSQVVNIKWTLNEESGKSLKNKPKCNFEGKSSSFKNWVLLEDDGILKIKTREKYFYNKIFQGHIPGQGNSINISFPVLLGSATNR